MFYPGFVILFLCFVLPSFRLTLLRKIQLVALLHLYYCFYMRTNVWLFTDVSSAWYMAHGIVKPVLNGHSQKVQKLFFKTNYLLMQVKSIAESSKGSILQYF